MKHGECAVRLQSLSDRDCTGVSDGVVCEKKKKKACAWLLLLVFAGGYLGQKKEERGKKMMKAVTHCKCEGM